MLADLACTLLLKTTTALYAVFYFKIQNRAVAFEAELAAACVESLV